MVSLYKFKKDEKKDIASPFVQLLTVLEDSPLEMKQVLNQISAELSKFTQQIKYDSRSQDVIKTSQNIIYFTNSLLEFFMKCLFFTTSSSYPEGDPEGEQKEETIIMHLEAALMTASAQQSQFKSNILKLIQLAIEEIHDYFETNYFDITTLKKSVEILREKKKEEMIAKYSKDDEKRNQQKMLKKMGLDILNDNIEDDQDKEPPLVFAAEAEYTDYVEDAGENADDNVDYDGYD